MRVVFRIVWRQGFSLVIILLLVLAGGVAVRVGLALAAGWGRVTTPDRSHLLVFEKFNEGAASTLPMGHFDRLRRVPGITAIVPETWAIGEVRSTTELVVVRAMDLRDLGVLGPAFDGEMPAIRAILARDTAPLRPPGAAAGSPDSARRFKAVLGRTLAKNLTQEKGDEGALKLAGGGEIRYTVIAVINAAGGIDDTCMFVEREAILAAGRPRQNCTAFRVVVADAASVGTVASTIEGTFRRLAPAVTAITETDMLRVQTRAVRELNIFAYIGTTAAMLVVVGCVALVVLSVLLPQTGSIAVLQLIGFSRGRLIGAGIVAGAVLGGLAGILTGFVARMAIGQWLPGLSDAEVFVPMRLILSDDFATIVACIAAGAVAVGWPARWIIDHALRDSIRP